MPTLLFLLICPINSQISDQKFESIHYIIVACSFPFLSFVHNLLVLHFLLQAVIIFPSISLSHILFLFHLLSSLSPSSISLSPSSISLSPFSISLSPSSLSLTFPLSHLPSLSPSSISLSPSSISLSPSISLQGRMQKPFCKGGGGGGGGGEGEFIGLYYIALL